MAIEKTDTKRLTSLHRTNGISEDVLKKLNLVVKKQINEHNSDLKKINENKRKGDQDELKKLEDKIRTFIVSIENGDLVEKIISDLNKEMGVDNVFSDVKDSIGMIGQIVTTGKTIGNILNDVQQTQINGDLAQNAENKVNNYTQKLIENLLTINRTKIGYTFKNESPFLNKTDVIIKNK
jgi:hypothetical protein